jgi:hypothetical protein
MCICNSFGRVKLAVSNRGGTIVSYPDGRFFNGTTTPTGYVPGPYKWMMIGLNTI